MKLYALSLVLLLSACATPVKVPFPEAPGVLLKEPKQLETIRLEDQDTVALSDFTAVVVRNYAVCHENMIKYQSWQHWYKDQKELYDQRVN